MESILFYKNKYSRRYLPLIKNYWNKNKIFLASIFVLLLLNVIQFLFWLNRNSTLEKNILAANAGLADQKQRIDRMGQYFETKGNITIGALLETVDKLQKDETVLQATMDTMSTNIGIANDNVNKYNSALTDIYDRLNKLQQQINLLIIYGR